MANAVKKKMQGKKTYAALAAAGVSLIAAYAQRKGVDLGPISGELVEIVAFLMLGVAAWARSVAGKVEAE
jgi:hypothetical protein